MATTTDTGDYAHEQLTFSTVGAARHIDVTLNLTYSTTQTKSATRQGYYDIVAATGTYDVVDKDGTVVRSYPITELLRKGHTGDNDNRLYVDSKTIKTVGRQGISFQIAKPTAGTPNGIQRYNFFYSNKFGSYELYTPYTDTDVKKSTIQTTPITAKSAAATATTSKTVKAAAENDAVAPVCFASGTRIATARGEVAVETLAVGDLVVTTSGALRPIRWLGHRTIDCRRHPRPELVLPVRIAAHAFGAGLPARDLLVSPGHAICVDVMGEALVPAAALVNETTVAQIAVERITYWHVELDAHDVLLADGLPAESYLEMGNRLFFAESGTVALAATPDAAVRTHADFCRPFHVAGAVVDAVRTRLAARSVMLAARSVTLAATTGDARAA